MTTNPPVQDATSPDARQGLDVAAVLFGVVIVFLAQGILGRVVQRAQQSFLPPGPGTHTLTGSTLMLPALQVAVCTLFLIPWALLGDRYGPRLPYVGGLLVWALGVLAGSWSGSMEFLLTSYAFQAAGVAAVIPATLTVITSAQPRPGGFLTGVVVAFPALLHLPGSLIADLLTRSTDWRTTLILVSGAAIPPLLLGWLAIPSGPATAGSDDDPPPERPAGRGRAAIQTLLLGAALAGVRIHLELSFAAHHGALRLSDSTEYARAHSGMVDFPFAAGLAVGFIAGAVFPGGHRKTVLGWVIAAPGPVMASVPLLPSGSAVLTGSVLASVGLGIGLSGQLIALLRLADGNRTFRASALFQVAQNLGYGVGIGLPVALILTLGEVVSPEARGHLFLGYSLALLVAGLVVAVRKPRERAAAQRDGEEWKSHPTQLSQPRNPRQPE